MKVNEWTSELMSTCFQLFLVQALAEQSDDRRFAFDSYRRFIQMYADVVLGIEVSHFEKMLERAKQKRGVKQAPLERFWILFSSVFNPFSRRFHLFMALVDGI